MLRRISYFILGVLLGFAATIFWASEAGAANYVLEADTSSYGYGSISSPGGEQYPNAVDGNVYTKYLNFNKTGAGVTVGFANARIMRRMIMSTANDVIERDPMTINIYGSSTYYGSKTLIQSNVATNLSTSRYTDSTIDFENNTAYQFYTIEVTSVRNYYAANSFQFGELTFYYDTEYTAPQQYSSSISGAQTIRKNNLTTTRDALTNNNIYIDQAGDNNTITIEQSGNNNSIQGINQQRARLYGNGNNITIKQGDPIDLTGKNLIKLETDGASNTLNLTQGRNPQTGLADGAESSGHIISLGLTGNSNNVTAKQSNDGGNNSGHFAEINISGNTNTLNLTQGNNTGKTLFGSVTGNSNSLTASQTGTGADFLDITLTGNGHNVNSAQSGAGNHAATINLTNSGGASSVTLTQGGSTAQTYSIQQSCTNPAGCSVSVTQP